MPVPRHVRSPRQSRPSHPQEPGRACRSAACWTSKLKQSPDPLLSGSLESELQAASEILELLPIATCICDAAGRIVQYNRRAVELWGRVPEPGQTHDQFTAQQPFLQP